jgi:hypothetical protein
VSTVAVTVSVSGPATVIAELDAAAPGSGPKPIEPLPRLRNPDPHLSRPGKTAAGLCHWWRRPSGIGPPADAVGPGVEEIVGVDDIVGVGCGPTLE